MARDDSDDDDETPWKVKYYKQTLELLQMAADDPCVTKLYIEEPACGPGVLAAIANVLRKNTKVDIVEFYKNRVDDAAAKAVSEMLLVNKHIRHLTMSNTEMEPAGFADIARSLHQNKTLIELRICYNNAEGTGKMFGDALAINMNLTSLHLSHCHLVDSDVCSLAGGLRGSTALKVLEMDNNAFGAGGAAALATALEANDVLQHLCISNNNFGHAGCGALGAMLKKNSTLVKFDIRGCGIGDEGAYLIADGIAFDSVSLKILKIGYNDIGCTGIAALCVALSTNNSITKLFLDGTEVCADGAKALAGVLRRTGPLEILSIQRTLIAPDVFAILVAALTEQLISGPILAIDPTTINDQLLEDEDVYSRIRFPTARRPPPEGRW